MAPRPPGAVDQIGKIVAAVSIPQISRVPSAVRNRRKEEQCQCAGPVNVSLVPFDGDICTVNTWGRQSTLQRSSGQQTFEADAQERHQRLPQCTTGQRARREWNSGRIARQAAFRPGRPMSHPDPVPVCRASHTEMTASLCRHVQVTGVEVGNPAHGVPIGDLHLALVAHDHPVFIQLAQHAVYVHGG